MPGGPVHADDRPTRFAGWPRGRARAALAIAALAIGGLLAVAETARTRPVATRVGDTDVDLFRKVVLRIHAGEGHDDAFQRVFEEYDYPVRSVFNYRTPLHAWLIGKLPGPRWGQALLAAIMLGTALTAYEALQRRGGRSRAAAAVVLMQGSFAYCFVEDMYLYAEVWSGTLIALSVSAYGLDRPRLGLAAGLLALFFRELALPYALAAWVLDWQQGRRRAVAAWGAGLALYGLYLLLHIVSVAPRIPRTGGVINASGWVQFGGLAFLLATARMNLLLHASPAWASAVYLPLSLLGLLGWRAGVSLRIGCAVGLYLAAFSVVGGLFNAYWGLMYAPLLPFGLVWAPASLGDLWAAGFPPASALRPRGPALLEGSGPRRDPPAWIGESSS